MNPRTLTITVTQIASQVTGTSAELREGDVLSIEQLFYGMMLPSGNDAAYLLAEYFGKMLQERRPNAAIVPVNQTSKFANTPVRHFLKEMNAYAHKLGMSGSNYDSPHGLMNKSNYSTAEDQAILVKEVMKSDAYRKIVGTKEFETRALGGRDREYLTVYKWENTNQLLGTMKGMLGCKTGITNAAGPCFAGYFEEGGIKLAMVLCHSSSMPIRWEEVRMMVNWYKLELEKTSSAKRR